MRNLSYDCIRIFLLILLIDILLPPISRAKIINNNRRTKHDAIIRTTSQSKGNAVSETAQEASSECGRDDNDLEKDNTYVVPEHKISKRSANAADTDFQRSRIEKSLDYDADPSSRPSSIGEAADYAEEANERMTRGESNDRDEKNDELVRVSRDVSDDPNKYADERSSLYDDYESKDVAKRGVLGSPEDYEEVEENSPVLQEDAAVAQEQESMLDEVKGREARGDVRVKSDRERKPLDEAEVRPHDLVENDDTRIIDAAASRPIDPARLEESQISSANDPYYRVGSPGAIGEASTSDGASKIEGSLANDEVASKSSGATKLEAPINVITTSQGEADANAGYEKRVEEQIQRKIDSIKDEIRRDIEARRRIRDIQENNARFDELREEEEREDEENLMDKSIDKRQVIAKRSIRGVADDAAASSDKNGEKKRAPKREEKREKQRRSIEPNESDTSPEHLSRETTNSEDTKRRSTANDGESSGRAPSRAFLKKKRERVRRTILMNDDHHRTRRGHSGIYASPAEQRDVRQRDELSVDQDSNAYRRTDDRMVPSSLTDEDEREQSRAAVERQNSLVSLTGSSQELSPRLAIEYKEAFGGLQSEPGGALARFKRIKRVLDGTDAKISGLR